jgi:hypothetical protein
METDFTFTATIWLWKGDSAWHFVSLPINVADEIADLVVGKSRGFGSVRVDVTSGDVNWSTSIFPDKNSGTYILPLKKEVRKLIGCKVGDSVGLTIRVNVEQI